MFIDVPPCSKDVLLLVVVSSLHSYIQYVLYIQSVVVVVSDVTLSCAHCFISVLWI